MTTIRRTACDPALSSCDDVASRDERSTADPRVRSAVTAPAIDDRRARESTIAAANAATAGLPVSRLTAAEAAQLPESVLDHQATALRLRLAKVADYRGRADDARELATVESELTRREQAKQRAAREAHGGVKICKRVADLPGSSLHGAEHWWIQTTRKSVGMGPATGSVPGHGESLPESFDTKLIDHSKEKATHCDVVEVAIDEDCVDREVQLDEPTGTWLPGLNDCHTVVRRIVSRCHDEAVAKALEQDTAQRAEQADAGAP